METLNGTKTKDNAIKTIKTIKLFDVTEISIGGFTHNLKAKVKTGYYTMNDNWNYLSIHYKKKTADFYLSEENLNIWFLGLSRFIKREKLEIKILSTFGFFIFKLKLKLIKKIKLMLEHKEKLDKSKTKLFIDIVKFAKYNHIGMENLPFVKVLLLFEKLSYTLNVSLNFK